MSKEGGNNSTKIELHIFGPFDVGCEKKLKGSVRQINQKHGKIFWDTEASHYATKQGCYVFALRVSKGFNPWYVGKTTKNFKQECFTYHNLQKYNEVLFRGKRGNPVIFLVAHKDKNRVPKRVIDEMETFLIRYALYANPELKNKAKTKLPNWSIKGVFRGGWPDTRAKAFVKMMSL
jgi:hypothetical protein